MPAAPAAAPPAPVSRFVTVWTAWPVLTTLPPLTTTVLAVTVMVLVVYALNASRPPVVPVVLLPPKRLLKSPKMFLPVWNARDMPAINLPPAMTPAAATMPLWSFAHSVNAAPICSVSNPALKPSINLPPMVLPSSRAPDASKPKMARSPRVIPLPMLSPIPATLASIQGRPVPSHHAAKGSATILSHAMAIFPHTSALAHSSELVNSSMVALRPAIFSSMVSMTSLITPSTAGILVVSQSANCRTYGDNLDPRDNFTPSTADCKRVMLPCMLFSMVSLMVWAAPSAL